MKAVLNKSRLGVIKNIIYCTCWYNPSTVQHVVSTQMNAFVISLDRCFVLSSKKVATHPAANSKQHPFVSWSYSGDPKVFFSEVGKQVIVFRKEKELSHLNCSDNVLVDLMVWGLAVSYKNVTYRAHHWFC